MQEILLPPIFYLNTSTYKTEYHWCYLELFQIMNNFIGVIWFNDRIIEADHMKTKEAITIQAGISAPVEIVWDFYTAPGHITKWNHASEDWHTTGAENDFKPGGKFNYRMEARDGSAGFDFWGIYDMIKTNEYIEYTLGDGRRVEVTFIENKNKTCIEVTFEAESVHSIELQRSGWQAILNNFKKYVEEKQ